MIFKLNPEARIYIRVILGIVLVFIFCCCANTSQKARQDAKNLYNWGLAFQNTGMLDKAIREYTKAIEVGPKYALVYCNRGNAYARKKEFDKAISDYTKAIEIDPGDAIAYGNRGHAYHDKGQLDKAISDYTKAIENGNYKARNGRGHAYAQKGQYDKAIWDFKFLSPLKERNPDAFAYNRLAWFLATCPDGRYRNGFKAIEYAKKALEWKKTSAYLDTLAAAYAENGDFTNAVKTEKKAVRLCKDPNSKKEFQELVEAYQSKKTYLQFKNSN